MKPPHARRSNGGFTGWDLLVVMATVGLLLVLLMSGIGTRAKPRSKRINCVSNLKQIGLAFRMWANDHGETFPMRSSTFSTNGGTMEFNLTGQVWPHFLAMSNELTGPKVLTCTSEKESKLSSWSELTNNSHLSYFVGIDADETRPQTILSGDRNMRSTVPSTNGVLYLRQGDPLEWTTAMHNKAGNIGFGDGSAHQINSRPITKELQSALQATGQPVYRLALPE